MIVETKRAPTRAEPAPQRPVALVVGAVLAQLAGLVIAGFCLFMALIVTYGIYSWSTPQIDIAIALPLIGIVVATPLGALVMSTGAHRRRWLIVAAVVAVSAAVLASAVTWLPVALGTR